MSWIRLLVSWRLLTIARFSLMTWFGISITYIRFHRGFKLQGFDRAKLPYASGLQPYLAYYAAVSTWVICFVSTLKCCITIDLLTLYDSLVAGRCS